MGRLEPGRKSKASLAEDDRREGYSFEERLCPDYGGASEIKDFDGKFDNGASFCKYLTEQLGMPTDLTNASVISKRFSKMRGEFPNWSFDDVRDPNAREKLNNIAKRFVAIYRKGQ